jgi:hypothetical protein
MFTSGQKVRSKGALYISSATGRGSENKYRKVYMGHVVRVYEHNDGLGSVTLCEIVTRYGNTKCNVSQLEAI